MGFFKKLLGLDIPKDHVRLEGATRGRLYVPKDESTSGNHVQTKAKRSSKLVGIKVIRADGTVEVIRAIEGE